MAAALAILLAAAVFALFGLPDAGLPMPTHAVGVVTPTCGLTRSTVALLRGDIALAWRFNPLGFVVVPAAALLVLRWLVGRTSGRWLGSRVHLGRVAWAAVAVAIFALWVRQQVNVAWIIEERL